MHMNALLPHPLLMNRLTFNTIYSESLTLASYIKPMQNRHVDCSLPMASSNQLLRSFRVRSCIGGQKRRPLVFSL